MASRSRTRFLGCLMVLGSVAAPDGAAGQEAYFLRGDVNADGRISISDSVMFGRWRSGGPLPPRCLDAADANDDGALDIADQAAGLAALFPRRPGHEPPPPPPFPVPGPDPTLDAIPCASYELEPAPTPAGYFRVGDATASPGAIVEVPVYLASSVEVEAFQLVVRYDPAVFALASGDAVSLAGTPWAQPRAEFASAAVLAREGVFLLGVVGNLTGRTDGVSGSPIPPGNDTLICKFRVQVSPGAAVGTTALLELTNGPLGEGVKPPYFLRSEITHEGEARYLGSALETEPGHLSVVAGDPVEPPVDPPEDPPVEPDEETTSFVRGDVNSDGRVSISDALMFRRFRFNGELPPPCLDAADVDDSGSLDLPDELVTLHALFSDGPQPPAPFPDPGPDPTLDAISCASYRTEPAPNTDDLIRIGDVAAAAGEPVEIPVYLTSSVEVDAVQLVVRYDPAVFIPSVDDHRNRIALNFEGTPWASPLTVEFQALSALKGEKIFTLGVVGSLLGGSRHGDPPLPYPPIPPGNDALIFKIPGRVAPGAAPGSQFLFEPSNGPGGDGLKPPYFLRNEIAHKGEARYVSFLPRTEPGVLRIIGDVTFFTRGDTNSDGQVDVADAVSLLGFLFLGGAKPRCPDAADADDNGELEVTDAVVILGHLFLGTGPIAAPHPAPGRDATTDGLEGCRER